MLAKDVHDEATLEVQISALSCILVLIQTCNYEYGPFYVKLYSLATLLPSSKSPFDLSEHAKLAFAKLMEYALKSTNLPHALLCSFIKVLSSQLGSAWSDSRSRALSARLWHLWDWC